MPNLTPLIHTNQHNFSVYGPRTFFFRHAYTFDGQSFRLI